MISAANSGVLHISKNPCFFLNARNSGRYLPACVGGGEGDRGENVSYNVDVQ